MNKIIKNLCYLLLVGVIFYLPSFALASAENGTIDPGIRYAWSDNIGTVNFSPTNGNVRITDAGITGYAWNSAYGWINLNPTNGGITNDSEGDLSGYAWGENLGWINFSGVTINQAGEFSGVATGDIIGNLTFNCTKCGVKTDWRSVSSRTGRPALPSFFQIVKPELIEEATTTIDEIEEEILKDEKSIEEIKQEIKQDTKKEIVKIIFSKILKIGSIGEDVGMLQALLKKFNFFKFPLITNYFGPITKKSLVSYQKEKKIEPASGELDEQTRKVFNQEKIENFKEFLKESNQDYEFTSFLCFGSRGREVGHLQVKLREIGYFDYPRITSYFGPVTRKAVIDLQKDYGIAPYPGYVGPKTREVLNNN